MLCTHTCGNKREVHVPADLPLITGIHSQAPQASEDEGVHIEQVQQPSDVTHKRLALPLAEDALGEKEPEHHLVGDCL